MTNSPATNQGQFNSADYDIDRITRIITASVLGDGSLYIGKTSKNAYYETAKTHGHEDYLGWLRSVVELVAPTRTFMMPEKPYLINGVSGLGKASDRMRSRTHPILTDLHATYYVNRKKIVPEGVELDLESIAILLMDDGCRHTGRGHIRICTDGFSLDSIEILQEAFVAVTDLPWTVVKRSNLKDGTPAYQLYLPRRYVVELAKMLKPFVFPSFYYKIGLEPDGITEIPLKMRSI